MKRTILVGCVLAALAGCGGAGAGAMPPAVVSAPDPGAALLEELQAVQKYTAPPVLVEAVKERAPTVKKPAPAARPSPALPAAVVVPVVPVVAPPQPAAPRVQVKPKPKPKPDAPVVTASGTIKIPYEFNSFAGPLPACGGFQEFARIRVGAPVLVSLGADRVAEGSVTSCNWVNTGSRFGLGGGGYNMWQPRLEFKVTRVPDVSGLAMAIGGTEVRIGAVRPTTGLVLVPCEQYTADLCVS